MNYTECLWDRNESVTLGEHNNINILTTTFPPLLLQEISLSRGTANTRTHSFSQFYSNIAFICLDRSSLRHVAPPPSASQLSGNSMHTHKHMNSDTQIHANRIANTALSVRCAGDKGDKEKVLEAWVWPT